MVIKNIALAVLIIILNVIASKLLYVLLMPNKARKEEQKQSIKLSTKNS